MNPIHSHPCVCNLCRNQPFLWLLMQLFYVSPCKNDLKSHTGLQNGFTLHMWLWLAIIASLDENVIISSNNLWHSMINENENVIIFAINNVVHRWLDIKWYLTQVELWLQIIVVNVHMFECQENMLWLMKLLDLVYWIYLFWLFWMKT
jgi:hypothetical protein